MRVVIHNISLPPGEFGGDGVIELFTNRLDPEAHPYYREIYQRKVSAHFFIRRDGRLIQFVPCEKRAWHAGVSRWQGRERCNDFSIGVELEGADEPPVDAAEDDDDGADEGDEQGRGALAHSVSSRATGRAGPDRSRIWSGGCPGSRAACGAGA